MSTISRAGREQWAAFAPHAATSAPPSSDAACYVMSADGLPVSFAALRRHLGLRATWYVARAVTLPKYRGSKHWFELKDALGAALATLGQRLHVHPIDERLIGANDRADVWRRVEGSGLLFAYPSGIRPGGGPASVFEYVGPPNPDAEAARKLLAIPTLGGGAVT